MTFKKEQWPWEGKGKKKHLTRFNKITANRQTDGGLAGKDKQIKKNLQNEWESKGIQPVQAAGYKERGRPCGEIYSKGYAKEYCAPSGNFHFPLHHKAFSCTLFPLNPPCWEYARWNGTAFYRWCSRLRHLAWSSLEWRVKRGTHFSSSCSVLFCRSSWWWDVKLS